MSLRLHMLAPATWGGFEMPPPDALYFHHPIGYHHLLDALDADLRRSRVAGARAGRRRRPVRLVGALRPGARVLVTREPASSPCSSTSACRSSRRSACSPIRCCWRWLRALVAEGLPLAPREADHARARPRVFRLRARRLHDVGGLLHRPLHRRSTPSSTRSPARPHASVDTASAVSTRSLAHVLVTGTACWLMMAFHIWFTHHAGVWDDFLDSYRLRHSPPSSQYVIDRHMAVDRDPLRPPAAHRRRDLVRGLARAGRRRPRAPP